METNSEPLHPRAAVEAVAAEFKNQSPTSTFFRFALANP
jgi:hypothetical protein